MGLTGNPARGRQHSHPASILHVHRHVQSQITLKSFAVNVATRRFLHPNQHQVYYVAGDETDRKKDQDAQYEQGGDYEQ